MGQRIAPQPQDLNSLSDQELEQIVLKDQMSQMSDEELQKIVFGDLNKPEPSLVEKAGTAVKDVAAGALDVWDRYTTRPVVEGLYQATKPKEQFSGLEPLQEPSIWQRAKEGIVGGVAQIGRQTETGATGAMVAKNLGASEAPTQWGVYKNITQLSDKDKEDLRQKFGEDWKTKAFTSQGYEVGKQKGMSNADSLGFLIEMGADPTNLATFGIGQGVKGAKAAVKYGLGAAKEIVPGAKVTTEVIKNAAKAMDEFVKPSVAKDFGKFQAIAEKNGIDLTKAPEAIEFGPRSPVTRAGRAAAEGPLGQARLDKHLEFVQDVSNKFDEKLATASGGQILSKEDAGIHLRNAYDKATQSLFETADTGYDALVKEYPGLMLSKKAVKDLESKLSGIEKFAKGRIARGLSGAQEEQGRRLINAVAAIRSTNGSVKQAVEALRDLGEIGYQSKYLMAEIPPDIKRTRELYTTLREAIYDTVKTEVKDGGVMEGAMRISNGLISDFINTSEGIAEVLGDKSIAPEVVFNRLTKTTDQIEKLKKIFAASPQDFNVIKGAYLGDLVKRNPDGVISFAGIRNSMGDRSRKDVFKKLFTPQEQQDLLEIALLGDRAGIPHMSTSGTGAAASFKEIPQKVMGAAIDENIISAMKSSARARSSGKEAAQAAASSAPKLSRSEQLGQEAKKALGLTMPQVGLRLPRQMLREENKKKEGK